jgi:tetratricopeptide (TPR) repeat protein
MVMLALLIGACSGGETLRSRNQDANDAYDRASYQEALEIYHELIAQRPDIGELSHNAGNALHRANLYERAVQETQRALPPQDDRIGALTYYALGNHYLAMEEYELAYDSYRSALLLDPTDEDAKYNLELTILLVSGEMQEPPPQAGEQPGPGEGEGEQGGQQPQPGEQGDGSEQQPSPDPGQPGAGDPQQPGPPDGTGQPSGADVNRLLEEALRGLNETLTFEEAQRILDLLQEQQQNQRLPGGGTTPTGPDY